MDNRPSNEVLYTILVGSYSISVSGMLVGLASLKKLILSLLGLLFIRLARMMVLSSRSLFLLLNRCKTLEALFGSLSYQPPFRSASLAGITSPGSICICPELGLDWFFLPFLPVCCHPLTCDCILALSGVYCGICLIRGLKGD